MTKKYLNSITGQEVSTPNLEEIALPVSTVKDDLLVTKEKITKRSDPEWEQALDRYMYIIEGALPAEQVGEKTGGFITTDEGRVVFIGGPGQGGGGAATGQTPKALSEKLTTNEIEREDEGQYLHGAYESHLISIEDDGRAIAKPNDVIHDFSGTWDNEEKTAFAEVAAYEVAQELGYTELVPPTVLRVIGGRIHSVQAWEENAMTLMTAAEIGIPELPAEATKRMVVLDILIGNIDRHNSNAILSHNASRLKAIDHGLAFADIWDNRDYFYKLARGARWRLSELFPQTKAFTFTETDAAGVRRTRNSSRIADMIIGSFGDTAYSNFQERCDVVLEKGESEIYWLNP